MAEQNHSQYWQGECRKLQDEYDDLAEQTRTFVAARAPSVINEILEERNRQEHKWGEQNHSPMEWLPILMEEVGEASKEALENHFKGYYKKCQSEFRREMVQVAAVALAMIECYDRNNS